MKIRLKNNFSDFKVKKYRNLKGYEKFYDYISEKMAEGKKIYLLFDELQEVVGWEKAIESFRIDFDVYILPVLMYIYCPRNFQLFYRGGILRLK